MVAIKCFVCLFFAIVIMQSFVSHNVVNGLGTIRSLRIPGTGDDGEGTIPGQPTPVTGTGTIWGPGLPGTGDDGEGTIPGQPMPVTGTGSIWGPELGIFGEVSCQHCLNSLDVPSCICQFCGCP